MNALSTVWHVLKHQLRQHRIILMAFYGILLLVVTLEGLAFPRELDQMVPVLLRMGQLIGFVLLVARVFLSNSPSDTQAQWWTRPMSFGHILGAKIAFLLVFLFVPSVGMTAIGWLSRGFALDQVLLASGELAWFLLGIGILVGGLTSVCAQFRMVIAVVAIPIMLTMMVMWLAHRFAWRTEYLTKLPWTLSQSELELILFGAFVLIGVGCMLALYRFRSRRMFCAFVGLLALAPLWMPPVEAPRWVPGKLKGESVVTPAAPKRDGSESQLIMRNLALEGLGADEFASPLSGEFTFTDTQGKQAVFSLRRRYENPGRDLDLLRQSAPLIRKHLPAEVDFIGGAFRRYSFGSRSRVSQPNDLDHSKPGHLGGAIEFLVHEVTYHGEMACRRGGAVIHRGHGLHVLDVEEMGDELVLKLRTVRPRLIGAPRLDDRRLAFRRSLSPWVLAVIYPNTSEVDLHQIQQYQTGGVLPMVSRSYANVSLKRPRGADEAARPTLHIFRMVVKGAYAESFAWDEHQVDTRLNLSEQPSYASESSGASSVSLTADAVKSLEDLATVPSRAYYKERNRMAETARELMAADTDAALARVPWINPLHAILREVLEDELTEGRLETFREALKRDPRLIQIVERKQWREAFAEAIREELSKRSPYTEPAFVRMGFHLDEEALREPLVWQFAHNRRIDHRRLYASLEAMIGKEEADATVRRLWERARWGRPRVTLTVLALGRGLPGALEAAVAQIYDEGEVRAEGESVMVQALRGVTQFEGDLPAFYDWVTANVGQLAFDPATEMYRNGS